MEAVFVKSLVRLVIIGIVKKSTKENNTSIKWAEPGYPRFTYNNGNYIEIQSGDFHKRIHVGNTTIEKVISEGPYDLHRRKGKKNSIFLIYNVIFIILLVIIMYCYNSEHQKIKHTITNNWQASLYLR